MKNLILKNLEKAKHGYINIELSDGSFIEVGTKGQAPVADIKIKNDDLFDLVLLKGDIGFGEAYIKNYFETTNIADLLLFIVLNQKEFESIFHSNRFYSFLFNIKNFFKKNSLKGSKKNIEFHYDLGNDFYKLWLDETMSYSSALYYDDNQDLKTAQQNKYQRILSKLNRKGENILEIGCGWGGFINEAEQQDFQVTGLTLSNQQKLYTDELVKTNNYKSVAKILDYRNETGVFDNIVSIEMFEAVGAKYWNDYFKKIKQCLKKDGFAVVQTITIANEFYDKYKNTSDFIREYIFPGGFLPSPEIFKYHANQNGLDVSEEYGFADSYAKTLLIWLERVNSAKQKIINLGYDEFFIRKWQFYLAYCAASFTARRTNVYQYSMVHA